MPSWLRVFGSRVALLCVVVSTAFATHAAVAKPQLPFALLEAFDQAFEMAYQAAERDVVRLETVAPPAPRRDVAALLRQLEELVDVACDAASTRLDIELAAVPSLSAERRCAVLGCIERHLHEARRGLACTADPDLQAEYSATCERLREIRALI